MTTSYRTWPNSVLPSTTTHKLSLETAKRSLKHLENDAEINRNQRYIKQIRFKNSRSLELEAPFVKFYNFVCPLPPALFTVEFKRVVAFFLETARTITMAPLDMEITSRRRRAPQTAAQFDLVARIYPALERLVFGLRLDDARKAFFEEVVEADRVLLVGEGNGRFLKSLIARKRAGCVSVLESSKVMIRLAKNRAGDSEKVGLDFIEADFRVYRPEHEFDCVVTHFFLDLFNPPSQLAIIEKMAELIADGGTWINVDFVPARTLWPGILMSLQYAFFRVVSRIESKRCFDESEAAAAAGWTITEAISYLGGLVVAKRYRKGLVGQV